LPLVYDSQHELYAPRGAGTHRTTVVDAGDLPEISCLGPDVCGNIVSGVVEEVESFDAEPESEPLRYAELFLKRCVDLVVARTECDVAAQVAV